MPSEVVLIDNSATFKAALAEEVYAWLYTWSNEIASQAKRNCKMDGNVGVQLRGSYTAVVDTEAREAKIGSPLESAYWEEYGTGSHADTVKNGGKPGRPMWWVYVTDKTPRADHPIYRTEKEAKAIAAAWREDGEDAHASNGTDPHYTLERAFANTKHKAKADARTRLRGLK